MRRALIAILALVLPCAPAPRAGAQPASGSGSGGSSAPAGGDGAAAAPHCWRCQVPGGRYVVLLNQICSVSTHEYLVDAAGLVYELTIVTNGSGYARFYSLEPYRPALPSSAGQAALDSLQEKARTIQQRIDPGGETTTRVLKNYPTTNTGSARVRRWTSSTRASSAPCCGAAAIPSRSNERHCGRVDPGDSDTRSTTPPAAVVDHPGEESDPMCLAVPGQVISVEGDDELSRVGRVSFDGVVKEVSLACVPEARPGDYVIVHVGFALSVVDEREARAIFDTLRQMGDLAGLEPEGGAP